MPLSLKPGETHTTFKGVPMTTAYVAVVTPDLPKRIFIIGVYASKAVFQSAVADGVRDVMTVETGRIEMSPSHFATYLYPSVTRAGSFKALDLAGAGFTSFLLTEKPAVQGLNIDWGKFESDTIAGVPF